MNLIIIKNINLYNFFNIIKLYACFFLLYQIIYYIIIQTKIKTLKKGEFLWTEFKIFETLEVKLCSTLNFELELLEEISFFKFSKKKILLLSSKVNVKN